jgi:ubiquinone/menaquinone biosynthesis C-methylase UbiE
MKTFFISLISLYVNSCNAWIALNSATIRSFFATVVLSIASLEKQYDKYAINYDQLDNSQITGMLGLSDLRDSVSKYVRGNVLEVAVGTGIQLSHYKWSSMLSYQGVDLSTGMLSKAREKLVKLQMSKSVIIPAELKVMNAEHLQHESSKVRFFYKPVSWPLSFNNPLSC